MYNYILFWQVQSETVVSRDGTPDIYWFLVRGLHPVLDVHGPDSPAAWEAKQLLRDSVADLKKAFITAYDGEVNLHLIVNYFIFMYECSQFN